MILTAQSDEVAAETLPAEQKRVKFGVSPCETYPCGLQSDQAGAAELHSYNSEQHCRHVSHEGSEEGWRAVT